LLTKIFAKDSDDLSKIDDALNIANSGFSKDLVNVHCGELADFSYIINGGNAMLMITPPTN